MWLLYLPDTNVRHLYLSSNQTVLVFLMTNASHSLFLDETTVKLKDVSCTSSSNGVVFWLFDTGFNALDSNDKKPLLFFFFFWPHFTALTGICFHNSRTKGQSLTQPLREWPSSYKPYPLFWHTLTRSPRRHQHFRRLNDTSQWKLFQSLFPSIWFFMANTLLFNCLAPWPIYGYSPDCGKSISYFTFSFNIKSWRSL